MIKIFKTIIIWALFVFLFYFINNIVIGGITMALNMQLLDAILSFIVLLLGFWFISTIKNIYTATVLLLISCFFFSDWLFDYYLYAPTNYFASADIIQKTYEINYALNEFVAAFIVLLWKR